MGYKIVCLLCFVLIGLWLPGCANYFPRLDNLAVEKPDEALVVAKIRVIYNGEDVTKGCSVLFDSKWSGTLDESGYIITRLPVGKYTFSHLIHNSGLMQHRFKAEELTMQIKGGDTINYVGDITFEWKGMNSAGGVALIAFTGVVGNGLLSGGDLTVVVESHEPQMQAEIKRRFAVERKLTPSYMVVKPQS